VASHDIDLEIKPRIGNGGRHGNLSSKMEYHIRRKLADDSLHIVAVPDVAMLKQEGPHAPEPLQILRRTEAGQVIKDCDVVSTPYGMGSKIAPQKSAPTGYQQLHSHLAFPCLFFCRDGAA